METMRPRSNPVVAMHQRENNTPHSTSAVGSEAEDRMVNPMSYPSANAERSGQSQTPAHQNLSIKHMRDRLALDWGAMTGPFKGITTREELNEMLMRERAKIDAMERGQYKPKTGMVSKLRSYLRGVFGGRSEQELNPPRTVVTGLGKPLKVDKT